MRRISLALLLTITGCAFRGVFVGGTDFLVDYRDPSAFHAGRQEAHSINAGASFAVGPVGVDVLPIIVGVDRQGHATTAAAIFWRWYVWQPSEPPR